MPVRVLILEPESAPRERLAATVRADASLELVAAAAEFADLAEFAGGMTVDVARSAVDLSSRAAR